MPSGKLSSRSLKPGPPNVEPALREAFSRPIVTFSASLEQFEVFLSVLAQLAVEGLSVVPVTRLPETLSEIDDDEALRQVAAFLADAQSPVYPSEVAESLLLPLDQVERAFETLSREGLITLE